jgi:hypothetical protein
LGRAGKYNETLIRKQKTPILVFFFQCNCAKAAAAFSWFSFFAWLATAVCSAILLWHEKKLRHAETSRSQRSSNKDDGDSQTTASNSSTRYDEDARTIIDMNYSEKDKLPAASYKNDELHQCDSTDAASPTPPISTAALPAPSAPPMTNSEEELVSPFASTVKQPHDTASSAMTALPYTPSNLASPYVPPQASVASPSPYPTPLYALNSPYTNTNAIPYQTQHGPSPFIPPRGSPYAQRQFSETPQFTASYPNTPTSALHQYGLPDTMYQHASPTGYHAPTSALNQAPPTVHQYQQQPRSYSQQYPQ